jgi:hypothetical protein
MNFEEWWLREGQTYRGDAREVALAAFSAARAQSGNYTADNSTVATVVTFANGRKVSAFKDGTLSVGWAEEVPCVSPIRKEEP